MKACNTDDAKGTWGSSGWCYPNQASERHSPGNYKRRTYPACSLAMFWARIDHSDSLKLGDTVTSVTGGVGDGVGKLGKGDVVGGVSTTMISSLVNVLDNC